MTTQTPIITPGEFGSVPQDGPFVTRAYLGRAANAQVLRDAAEQLQVSPYTLFKLLGLSYPHNGYRWLSGVRRPAPLYLVRLIKLLLLVQDGLDLLRVSRINWATGNILLKGQEAPRRVDSKSRSNPTPAMNAFREVTP